MNSGLSLRKTAGNQNIAHLGSDKLAVAGNTIFIFECNKCPVHMICNARYLYLAL